MTIVSFTKVLDDASSYDIFAIENLYTVSKATTSMNHIFSFITTDVTLTDSTHFAATNEYSLAVATID